VRHAAVAFVAICSAILPSPGQANDASPAPPAGDLGFWKILVKPKARWVLYDVVDTGKPRHRRASITVETYDIRTVGTARVGRLRWSEGGRDALVQCGFGCPTRVAVTSAGLYFIDDDASDEKILQALKHHPSRSNPPKEYQGTKRNGRRYLDVEGDVVCMGETPLESDGPCEETCFATVCIDADKGVVQIGGSWAPDDGLYAQDGYESPFVHSQ
jgi:hypothetical protein